MSDDLQANGQSRGRPRDDRRRQPRPAGLRRAPDRAGRRGDDDERGDRALRRRPGDGLPPLAQPRGAPHRRACARSRAAAPVPLTGDLETDIARSAEQARHILAEERFRSILPLLARDLVERGGRRREGSATFHRVAPNHRRLADVYEELAAGAGLRDDIDGELVSDIIIGRPAGAAPQHRPAAVEADDRSARRGRARGAPGAGVARICRAGSGRISGRREGRGRLTRRRGVVAVERRSARAAAACRPAIRSAAFSASIITGA